VILVLAEDQDPHADVVIHAIESRGGRVLRINPERLDERLHELDYTLGAKGELRGKLRYLDREADLAEVRSVFCRNYYFEFAEDGDGKNADDLLVAKELEAAFKSLCESLACRWVNAPWHMDACDSKIVQMQVARRIGFHVPDLRVTNQPEALLEFTTEREVVVKQLSDICVFEEDGVSAKGLYTHRLHPEDFRHLEDLKHAPAFFSTFIDKQHDLRVTVVGEQVFAVRIFSQEFPESRVDFRRREGDWKMESCELPDDLTDKIMWLMRYFHLSFGALDFAVDHEGEPWFLEVNAEGNWLWMESELGLPISGAIADLLLRSCQRQFKLS